MGRRVRHSGYELGRVLRVSASKLLVETRRIAKIAAKVVDADGRDVGYVSNIFGPENKPITVVKVTSQQIPVEGDVLYVKEKS